MSSLTELSVLLVEELEMISQECFMLHGWIGVKKSRQLMMEFTEREEPKVLLSKGSLIGKGVKLC